MDNIDKAMESLEKAKQLVKEVLNRLSNHPELLYSGFLANALSEFAEASIFIAIIQNKKIPTHNDLKIPPIPYLQGLGDVVGELRRKAIEHLGKWEIEKAKELLRIMDSIHTILKSLDYPEALIPGIKRKADIAKRLTEDLRTMITDIKTRKALVKELKKFGTRINSSS